jgi:2-phospho-L-lactate transferase/gluconeogenesis factor (CofD/UPF0052 family)
MQTITRRLGSLSYLVRPLALMFVGVVLLSLGVAYLFIHIYRTAELPAFFSILTLQFLPRPLRGLILLLAGLATLGAGVWHLSGIMVIPLRDQQAGGEELVLGYQRQHRAPRIVVLSGGAGMLVLANLSEYAERLTCIVPVQDPVEYYYRASGLLNYPNVYFVVPMPKPLAVSVKLDDGQVVDVKQVDLDEHLAERHVVELRLETPRPDEILPPVTRLALDAVREADAIVLGPGSLFESVLPNLLIDEFRAAVQSSKACKIYVCNLMTEPGLTTGFTVGDHIRQLRRYGVVADYVLVNAQRIEAEIHRLYAAAHQEPVYLSPDEYEETAIVAGDRATERSVVVEGSTVVETDLSSSVVQYSTSLSNPGESRAVRVLRHDGQKLTTAIMALIRRAR